ncbi:cation-translocating P-type ATPase [Companilactobacillus kimchiensis]|uniref:Cation-transporting ATPase n=1 Tax=Companilactobacillus kimchiensis TaxID=993692 RepID=A0A0R2LDW6_9LACO|nr:cation-transporting P-type ATPase [Companilactobacillus kimchiensis]KRO00120.1 cation-transporting ATPase [Companilactobacillus kimchiensis]
MAKFYQQTKDVILKQFSVDQKTGLSSSQVQQAREQYGENKLSEKKADPYWKVFLKSFKEPIVLVLLGAVLLSFLSSFYAFQVQGNPKHGQESLYEAIAILILIFINAILGFWQEISARKSLNALKEMNNRYSQVLRDGDWQKIPTVELVVGDILKVMMGDFVETDVRWIETDELQVIESHLTGEPDAIPKNTEALQGTVEIGDQANMGFSGSTVSNGQGIGLVVATGENTELGNIARLIQSVDVKDSPLQTTINKLTKILMKFSAGIVVLTFVIGIIRAGEFSINSITSVLSTSIALAVASIPDALPAVLSIVLTIGAAKMAKNKGLIKSLSSVETLGSTSYICSDKTGTLTKNEMTVTKFYENGNFHEVAGLGYTPTGKITGQLSPQPSIFLSGAVLCNEASVKEVDGKFKPFGNPTEVALNVLGQKANVIKDELLQTNRIVRTLPFTSSRKMMSVIVKTATGYLLYTKGAPDVLLRNSSGILVNDQIDNSDLAKQNFNQIVSDYAEQALRTLAVGYKEITQAAAETGNVSALETDLTIAGVAGIIDPPREEVKYSVKTLNDANIEVVMITGDHEKTARAIAYDLGIVKSKSARVIKGIDIETMTDEQLFQAVVGVNVYARVTPEHKQRIVKQLQRHGQIVAMTGDGVNDAPALRVADIGIAMGINGTEVTKDSADLILLDDKFTTIENSVKSGRTIYANIKNFMRHELTTNVAEVLALLLGLFFFNQTVGDIPAATPTLTALMVLWVNMVSDALPSFALGYDVAESDIMKEKPRDPNESILANHTWSRVLIRGSIMGAMVYIAFILAANLGMNRNEAQTVAFLTLVFGQLWHVFDARSSRTIFRRNPFGNPRLVMAVLFAGIASVLVTIIPFFNLVMGTAQLPTYIYPLVIIIPALPTLLLSGLKEIFNIKIW